MGEEGRTAVTGELITASMPARTTAKPDSDPRVYSRSQVMGQHSATDASHELGPATELNDRRPTSELLAEKPPPLMKLLLLKLPK